MYADVYVFSVSLHIKITYIVQPYLHFYRQHVLMIIAPLPTRIGLADVTNFTSDYTLHVYCNL